MNRCAVRNLIGAGLTALAAGGAYALLIRPWLLRWGASCDDARCALPGDDFLTAPKMSATHVVTVSASPEEIWPWLVQIGQGRGGFYSYDWLENLFKLNVHSADSILPEYQQLQVGDVIPIMPSGGGPTVAILEPRRALVLNWCLDVHTGQPSDGCDPAGDYFRGSWAFVLQPVEPGKTRLVERFRLDYPADFNHRLYGLVLEPAACVMERKMLLGIKERVEAEHERVEEALERM